MYFCLFITIFKAYIDLEDKNGRNLTDPIKRRTKIGKSIEDKKAKNRRFWIGRLGRYAGGLVLIESVDGRRFDDVTPSIEARRTSKPLDVSAVHEDDGNHDLISISDAISHLTADVPEDLEKQSFNQRGT